MTQPASLPIITLLAAALAAAGPAMAQEPAAMAGMLAAHNEARRAVGVAPLQWSAELANSAASWAETLRGRGCAMRHSGRAGVGENLAWASGQRLTPGQVAGMWVDERRDYDAPRNACAPGAVCGHYTQVVWRQTSLVGCAQARCGGSEVWVCQYSPPGNVVGQRPF